MKLIKSVALLLMVGFFVACGKKEDSKEVDVNQSDSENIQNGQSDYSSSIQTIDTKINALKGSKEIQSQEINALISKRDSLKVILNQLESSLSEIKSKKITPGIDGVNEKLNELKGQKENLEEQLDLQKQEIVLGEKKVQLLKEEKSIYDAQKKALWDKGAPPEDFTDVDVLLSGITQRISEQKFKLKNLNRTVSDIEEQIVSIGEQRTSLSTKIRNNYTAKEIFEGYSKEETEKISQEISAIDEKLQTYLNKDSELTDQLTSQIGEKASLENEQTSLLEESKSKEEKSLQQKLEAKKTKKQNRLVYAFIGIGVFAILLFIFYFVGKNKRSKTKNN